MKLLNTRYQFGVTHTTSAQRRRFFWSLVLMATVAMPNAPPQDDPLQTLIQTVKEATHEVLGFTFEERTRWEEKDGVNFGKAVNQQDMLSRLRIGAHFDPVSWFEISAMGQDTRV